MMLHLYNVAVIVPEGAHRLQVACLYRCTFITCIMLRRFKVVAVIIPEGAHHLDLFFSNDKDPDSVRSARAMEVAAIRSWLAQ